jgi:hypothetical protein
MSPGAAESVPHAEPCRTLTNCPGIGCSAVWAASVFINPALATMVAVAIKGPRGNGLMAASRLGCPAPTLAHQRAFRPFPLSGEGEGGVPPPGVVGELARGQLLPVPRLDQLRRGAAITGGGDGPRRAPRTAPIGKSGTGRSTRAAGCRHAGGRDGPRPSRGRGRS